MDTTRAALLASAMTLSLLAAAPARAQVSLFADNEVRAASVKDRLREVRMTLAEGSDGARRLTSAVSQAFRGETDWAAATEDFYARKTDLLKRAAELDRALAAALSQNSPERADDVRKTVEDVAAKSDVLRGDFEFYMKLPRLAGGPERRAALSAMRLLAQTGKYPLTLAYYLDKTPQRPPFAPLSPGATAVRPR
ncbi:MAG TPA: hypothetical protein VN915_06535 [Elusimicrobiota bacterium]|nr:hypothetical protein [Elusimicrobiota bacterium]